MLARSVVTEAGRNLATGTTRSLWAALVFVVLVGGLAVADARVLVGAWQDAAHFRAAGAAVQTLAADRGEVVDGARCDSLHGASWLTGAGALRAGETVRVANLPSSDLTVWEATPGLVDLLADTARPVLTSAGVPSGIWLADDLAATLGASPGDMLVVDGREVAVAGVYTWPDDGRDRLLAYSVVVPVPALGAFERCWAEVWPVDPDAAGILFSAAAPAAEDLRLTQLNTTLGTTLDLPALVESRPTAAGPLVAAVVGLVLGLVAVRARRLEIASAMHAGVPKTHLAWQHLLETAAWLAAAVVVGAAATGVAALVGNPGPFLAVWASAGAVIVSGAAAVLVGALIAVATTWEKHLFRYFKER